jgi:hypothetical protein
MGAGERSSMARTTRLCHRNRRLRLGGRPEYALQSEAVARGSGEGGHEVAPCGRRRPRDRPGKMQVKGADMGLAHNLGGPGAVSAIVILSQPQAAPARAILDAAAPG